MFETSRILIPIILLSLTPLSGNGQTVKRGRNEGTFHIPASNVMGNGNITAFTSMGGFLSPEKLEANARLGAAIGIAEILQFTAQTSFINFQRLGPTEAHLQATLPGNNKLRFFGIGVSGDLYLSASLDTIAEGANTTKPEYNPYLLFSGTVDLDWLARPARVPVKTYVSFNRADNPQVLFQYNQIALLCGVEWKLYQHSLFVEAGADFYKDKRKNALTGSGYDERYVWISPGGRYRIRNRFSLLGDFKITLMRDFHTSSEFKPDILSVQLKFEAPITFRETDTEAIRTLVFMEKKKMEKTDESFTGDIKANETAINKFEKTMSSLAEEDETFDYTKEKEELIKNRERVESIMNEIEQMLHEESGEDKK